jgi:palmitoyltransferase ZDHHC9/14/18
MASHRSLPFSPSTPTVPVSQRPSQLPSSLSTVGISTKFESITTPRAGSASNSSGNHARTGSAVSSASRPRPSPTISGDPSSSNRRSFQGPGPILLSGTHAHGILPPPPFFRPSHPSQQPLSASDVSHRSSVASSNNVHSPSQAVHPSFPPQSLPHTHDAPYDSDGHSDSFPVTGDRTSRHSMQDAPRELPVRNQKHSREPLLPLSGHARSRSGSVTTHRSKPSLARNVVEKNAANVSAAARFRDSIERFRKGLSLESVRRSLSGSASASHSPMTADLPSARSTSYGATPFEVKESSDEDYKASDVVPLDLRHPSSNFIPYPPPTTKSEYPLSSVPMKREKSSRYVRNYERILSSNRWFMRGHMLMGGAKPWAFIGSLTLVFGIAGVWLGTTCIWWWHNKSPAVAAAGAYMCLLTISLMLSTVSDRFRSLSTRANCSY